MYKFRQKYLTIWQHSCEWNRWGGEFVFERPSSETLYSPCSAGVKSFGQTVVKNNDSVVLTQWKFCLHFNINRNDSVHSPNTVLLWVRNFRETASVAKSKPPGREPSVWTPENIEQVRQAFVISSRWSASKNAFALRTSNGTVRQILHEDLNFHPYKMFMLQAINVQGTVNRKTVGEVL